MKDNNLIIWDFDGVLFDSLRECIIVLQISLKLIKETNDPIERLDVNNLQFKSETNDLLKKMRPLRPYVIKGQDYIWQYLNFEKFDKNQELHLDYKKIFDTFFNPEQDKIFKSIFYKARKILQNTLNEDYYKIFVPYNGALKAFRESLKNYSNTNYICSARDYCSINYVLNHHDIQLDKNKIFSKDHSFNLKPVNLTKKEQIEAIVSFEESINKKFTVVEDQLELPISLIKKFPKIRIIYAKYGYGNNRDYEQQKSKAIFPVNKSSEIISLLSK